MARVAALRLSGRGVLSAGALSPGPARGRNPGRGACCMQGKKRLTRGAGCDYFCGGMNGWLNLLLLSGALRGRGAAAGF